METKPIAPSSAAITASSPQASAVAWSAIIAGAVAAVAVSVVLLTLGAGIGLSAASPWSGEGASVKAIGVAAVIWLIVVQWLSAAMGGYITGRLRVRWNYFDRDEVFFRDTTHGFLSWALAIAAVTLVSTTMAAGAIGSATTGITASAASKANDNTLGYFSDALYRSENDSAGSSPTSASDTRSETTSILVRGMGSDLSADDRAYLARKVAARTGMSEQEAEKRVDTVMAQAKETADAARKATATLAIATALSLAIGGFVSAVAAALGGRLRDE